MITIYKVTMTSGDVWKGASASFDSAAETATKVFLAPLRAVKSVVVIKIVD